MLTPHNNAVHLPESKKKLKHTNNNHAVNNYVSDTRKDHFAQISIQEI